MCVCFCFSFIVVHFFSLFVRCFHSFHVFSVLFISFHYFSCLFISFHFFSLLFMSFHFCSFLFINFLHIPSLEKTITNPDHLHVDPLSFADMVFPKTIHQPGPSRIDHRAAVLPWKGCFFTTPLCSRLTWSLAMSSAPHWREQSNDPLNHNSCRSRLNVDCREMSVGPRLWMHAFRISQQSQRISKRLSKRISKRLSKATLWGFSRPKQIEAIWNRQCRWALQTPSAHPPTILEAGG